MKQFKNTSGRRIEARELIVFQKGGVAPIPREHISATETIPPDCIVELDNDGTARPLGSVNKR